MSEPSAVVDSSQVLMYAILDTSIPYTGLGYVIADGKVVDPVPRLLIARNLYDDDILLFRCDEDWNVLGAGGYRSVEDAQRSAEVAYSGVSAKWQQFRALTSEELSEVQELRRHLRDPALRRLEK